MAVPARTRRFALFFLAVCVLFAGAGTWFATHDKDYTYTFDRAEEEVPRYEGNVEYYDGLTPEQRRAVDAAVEGEVQRFEHREEVPGTVVRKGETYYVFEMTARFDYANPGTFVPMLVGLSGLGLIVLTIRRDIVSRGL
ncbi:hypothetical protein [Halomarina pelagica]|uniref:hypothetical protein n=1 Tax=Halomarina pelagica TaxID=2961599 RepID=UPI0020C21D4F|nr:hypothetical protein [Halomarina sp. BND7]